MSRTKIEPLEDPIWEFKDGETTLGWTIRHVDRLTRNWSDETWKIIGIAQDLIDLTKIRNDSSEEKTTRVETKKRA